MYNYGNSGYNEDEAMRRAMEESRRMAPMGALDAPPPLPPKPSAFSSSAAAQGGPGVVIVQPARRGPPPQRSCGSIVAAGLIAAGCAAAVIVGVVVGLGLNKSSSSLFGGSAGATSPPVVGGKQADVPTVPTPQPSVASFGCSMNAGGQTISPTVYSCPATWSGNVNMRAEKTGNVCGGKTVCTSPNDACAGGFEVCGTGGDFGGLASGMTSSQCSTISATQYFLTAGAHVDIVRTDVCQYTSELTHVSFFMGCPASGRGSQVPCCGSGCVAPPSGCANLVYNGATMVAPNGACAVQPAPPAGGGVLCCVMTPAPVPGLKLINNAPSTKPTNGLPTVIPNPQVINYYWGPNWGSATFVQDKMTGLAQLMKGVTGTPLAAMFAQYFPTKQPLTITYVGDKIDTSQTPTFPYPSPAPSPQADNAAFVTVATAVSNVLCQLISNNPTTYTQNLLSTTVFNVYLDTPRPAWSQFCAFHDAELCQFTSQGNQQQLAFFYAMYWSTDNDAGCSLSIGHQRSQGLTNLASATLHEIFESATDCLGSAWFTSALYQFQEIADLCATTVYGIQLSDGSTWDTQSFWDDQLTQCSVGP